MLPIKGQRPRDNIMRENPRVYMLCETIIPPKMAEVDEKINGLFANRFAYKKKYICIKSQELCKVCIYHSISNKLPNFNMLQKTAKVY